MITITRTHEIACGHRVYGHESKCAHLHGHNYHFELSVVAKDETHALDPLGRVIDFSVIKSLLCEWLEANWDHKMLLFAEDPLVDAIRGYGLTGDATLADEAHNLVVLPVNPTAENIARLFFGIANELLIDTPVRMAKVGVWETGKCYAEYRGATAREVEAFNRDSALALKNRFDR